MNKFAQILKKTRPAIHELELFLQSPREYVYLYTYPTNKKVTIEPYNPKITSMGNEIIETIQSEFPELKIHWIGSVALKIPGQKDIDLYIECQPRDFKKYLPFLKIHFGAPAKNRPHFIEWHFEKGDCNIDLLLVDPAARVFQRGVGSFEVVRKNKELIEEYKNLKLASIGLTERAYEKKKLEFINMALRRKQ